MKYSDLNLSIKTDNEFFIYDGNTIEVKQYLPMIDKFDLINITLQKANEDGIYNDFKLSMYFQLNLVYLYSNIEFSMEDRMDESDIYDKLRSSGILQGVINLIPKEEYDFLIQSIEKQAQIKMDYGTRMGVVLNSIIASLPDAMAQAADIIEHFDPDKYKNVVDFAIAANGGRDILTNQPAQ